MKYSAFKGEYELKAFCLANIVFKIPKTGFLFFTMTLFDIYFKVTQRK